MKIENRMQLHLWREECKEKRQKETCMQIPQNSLMLTAVGTVPRIFYLKFY